MKKYVEVICKICSSHWMKRYDSIKKWGGMCSSCASKEVVHRVEVKEALRKSGIKVRIKYGAVRNRKTFKKGEMLGEKSHTWKGGKPNCIDCNHPLSSYGFKRCLPCNAKFKTGKSRGVEFIEKCRKGAKRGECHWNWNGGSSGENVLIRMSSKYKEWRKGVFMRDNYTCQECGAKNKEGLGLKINADHIKPFSTHPELRFNLDNGRTLCEGCHKKTDTFGWKLTNKRLKESNAA